MKTRDVLHLLPVWGFAVAQPLFDLLVGNPAFLSAHSVNWLSLVALAAMLSLALPLCLIGSVLALRLLSPTWASAAHLTLMSVMIVLTVAGVAWKLSDMSEWLAATAAIFVAVGLIVSYLKFAPARRVATVLIPATLVFPAVFLLSETVSQYRLPSVEPLTGIQTRETPHIVLLVFDELPTSVLTRDFATIDEVRFPNFARLAENVHWFRNATAVTTRTERAIPALLTGRRVVRDARTGPTAMSFPENLFTLLGGFYRINAFEPLSRMCPVVLCGHRSMATRSTLYPDLGVVYLHIVVPPVFRDHLPPIDQGWAEFKFGNMGVRFTEHYEYGRRRHVEEFIASIEPADEPTLHFLHSNLPHMPYQYLPSGNIFFRHTVTRGLINQNGTDRWANDPLALSKARKLFIWQVRFVDTLVGRLLARLKEIGIYNETLLIVTADHGVSIRQDDLRRRISATNSRDILGVPLFVKLPGQVHGQTSDWNVETIDIVPLIADVLGLDVPWVMDGASPLTGSERSFKAVIDREGEWQFPADLMLTGPRTMYAWPVLVPERAHQFVGRSLEEFTVITGVVEAVMSYPQIYGNVVPEVFVPCIVTGRLPPGERREVAVSVNGTIVALTTPYPIEGSSEFSATLDEGVFRLGANTMEVLLVGESDGQRTAESTRPADPVLIRVFRT